MIAAANPPRVLIDTSALKGACARLPRYFGYEQSIRWGPHEQTLTVFSEGTFLPNLALDALQQLEARALREVAVLAEKSLVTLLVTDDIRWEFWGLPKTDSEEGFFFGAPVHTVRSPVELPRVIPDDGSYLEALISLEVPRFIELQIMCGARQGAKINVNQLLDAFYLYSAECLEAQYFLTLERKLSRLLATHRRFPLPTVRLVMPTELVELCGSEA
jgi:hypothetical protein